MMPILEDGGFFPCGLGDLGIGHTASGRKAGVDPSVSYSISIVRLSWMRAWATLEDVIR